MEGGAKAEEVKMEEVTKPQEGEGGQGGEVAPEAAVAAAAVPRSSRVESVKAPGDAVIAMGRLSKIHKEIRPPRIKHKRLWLLWVAAFQFFISTADLWLDSSFVYEASRRGIADTFITMSFGIYYSILGMVDLTSGFTIQALGRKLRGTRMQGQQRAILQLFFYLLNMCGVVMLTWVDHPIAFPVLKGLMGFGPQLAVMQTYTQDACDNDWDFRKQATKAILFGRILGTLAAMASGTLVYETFNWQILVYFALGIQGVVVLFILTAPTRKVLWKNPPKTPVKTFFKSLPSLLWCICVVTFTTGFFFGTINAIQTLFIKDTFQISATYAGLLLACCAVVSIIAMAFYPIKVKATWMSVAANTLLMCVTIVVPFSVHVAMAIAFLSIGYACSAYLAAASQIMVDTITHPDTSVRVSGWNIACYSFGTATAGFVAGLMYEQYVWLPFLAASGLIFLVLGPFIYLIHRYYEHLKKEMATMSIVIFVAAKWRHKALMHRKQRMQEQEREMQRLAALNPPKSASATPRTSIFASSTHRPSVAASTLSRPSTAPPSRPPSGILKIISTLKRNKEAEPEPIPDPSAITEPSDAIINEPTSSSSFGGEFSESSDFSASLNLGDPSQLVTSTSAMLSRPSYPPPKPRSKSEDPAVLLKSGTLSSRTAYQVDTHDELDHHRVIHPPEEDEVYDDQEHHRRMAMRKPHYHSDVVQAVNMNDHLGLGLFVRLKSLKTNHYYNNMVKHHQQKHPEEGKGKGKGP